MGGWWTRIHPRRNRSPGARSRRGRRPGQGRAGLLARAPIALVVLVMLAGAVVPAAFGLTGRPEQSTVWGLLTSGLLSVFSALGVIGWWVGSRWRSGAAVWRLFFGLAVLAWGIGQLLLFQAAAAGSLGYPATGDLVSGVAAPLSLIGLMLVPRTSIASWPGVRLAMDSITVGVAGALLIWHSFLGTPGSLLLQNRPVTILIAVGDLSVLALVTLAAVRDLHCRLGAAVTGVAAVVIADLTAVHSAVDAVRDYPWTSNTLWCLGWPLVALGIVRYRPRTPLAADSPEQDRREATSSQTATVLAATLVVWVVLAGRSAIDEPGVLVLLAAAVGMLALRELLGAVLRVQLTAGLRVQAYRDPLTRLPNRRALTARLASIEENRAWVVLTLDLDGFKQVNDVLGHHAGDGLLVAVAHALEQNCPSGGMVARLGGDEFAVLGPGDLDAGRRLGDDLRRAVRAALEQEAPGMNTATSVGVGRLVVPPRRGPDATDDRDRLAVLIESGAALRAAKAGGRDRVEVYDGAVAAGRERRLLIERRLRHAVAAGGFRVHGQPVVDLQTGALAGFESLARWTDEDLGPVSPAEFIPVAEQSGLVVSLGERLVDMSVSAAARAGVFRHGLTVAINASPVQLRVPGYVDVLREHLAHHGVPPHLLVIEVTEAILIADDDPALRALAELTDLGVGIAIDDFGTGYSSLGYLRRLPVQVLKVDQSLTRNLLSEPKAAAIVEGVVRTARRMGVRVVMEGIEDESVASACRDVGAEQGQGWLYGRPMPWDAAAAVIDARSRASLDAGGGAGFART